MLGRRKQLWSPMLDALPTAEKAGAMAAQMALTMRRRGIKKAGICPTKDVLGFEAVVARVAGPDIGEADEQDPDELLDDAHCARDACTLMAGVGIARGPYGDLFYRVMQCYGVVIDFYYSRRFGVDPMAVIPPNLVPGPPGFRLFLDDLVGRFADALTESRMGTWPQEFPRTLQRLAREKAHELPLVQSVVNKPPMMMRLYP
jgi:hypothetical protein